MKPPPGERRRSWRDGMRPDDANAAGTGDVPAHTSAAGTAWTRRPHGGDSARSGAGAGAEGVSRTHLVLIPSYDTGPALAATVKAALAAWAPVWVVIDGSTDGSDVPVRAMAAADPRLRVLALPQNQGKGAAVLQGLEAAHSSGFTHALTMDADGQHPAHLIRDFMRAAAAEPGAMILGRPIFAADAPLLRVLGRRLSNGWVHLETLRAGIADSLYGFRVYPIAPLVAVMRGHAWMRRFDFDAEAVVRLAWRGVQPINLDAPVRYIPAEQGGVSQFRYVRDNLLLSWMHARLLAEFALRLPWLMARRRAGQPPYARGKA